jgi:hypothetical protein
LDFADDLRHDDGFNAARQMWAEEMLTQMQSESDDLKFRLGQGERYDEFLSDTWHTLFRCKYSREKWLFLWQSDFTAPLEFYYRALQGNKDITYVVFHSNLKDTAWIVNMIHDMPPMAAIGGYDIHGVLSEVDSDSGDKLTTSLTTFLAEHIQPQLAHSQHTCMFFASSTSAPILRSSYIRQYEAAVIAISFFGPVAGGLILRLRHYHDKVDSTIHISVKGATPELQRTIPNSLTTEDIDLHPTGSPSVS